MQTNQNDTKEELSVGMFLVALGIVYGDIGTSPMYVMKSIVEGNGGLAYVDEEFIVGSLSLVIWTITLLTTIKHVLIALRADNHGEGGIFALYSLVRDYGKWLIIPTMIGGCTMLADGVLTPAVTVTTAVEGLRSIEAVDVFLGEGQGFEFLRGGDGGDAGFFQLAAVEVLRGAQRGDLLVDQLQLGFGDTHGSFPSFSMGFVILTRPAPGD